MLSKITISSAVLAYADALITKGAGGTASDASASCFKCVADGFRFCAAADQPAYKRLAAGSSVTNKCIDTDASCASGETAIQASSSIPVEFTLLECPSSVDACGPQVTEINEFLGSATIDIGSSGIPSNDGCVNALKTSSGFPQIKQTGLYPATSSGAVRSIIHYTLDSRFKGVGTTDFPDTSITTPYNLESSDACGTATNCQQTVPKAVNRKNGSQVVDISTQLASQGQYAVYRANYYTGWIDYYKETSFKGGFPDLIQVFNATKPEELNSQYPYSMMQKVWTDYSSMGGWGDLSIQDMNPTSSSLYQFGVYGAVAGGSYAVDLNNERVVDRMAIVVSYNSGSGVVSQAEAKLEAEADGLSQLSQAIAAPSFVQQGALKMVGTAMTLVALAGLF